MGGKSDLVEQALKLIAGGLKEEGTSAAQRLADNKQLLETAGRLGNDTADIGQLTETKKLMDFHKNFMSDLNERAASLAEIMQKMRDQGAFPMDIGTRFMTSKSRELGNPPHVITGYYVNPKDPYNSYGYRVRQEWPNGDFHEGNMMIRDPKLEAMHGSEKWQKLQEDVVPMTGPKPVKAAGGRTGYAGKGRVIGDAIDEALSLISRQLAPSTTETIKGADLLKKVEGMPEDPIAFSKFSKPFEEMQYSVEKLPKEEYKTIDPYDLVKQNATIAGHISDRTAAGRNLTEVGGIPLTEPLLQRGGADYQRTTLNAWANRPGAAKGLNRKLNEASGFEWDAKKKAFVPSSTMPEDIGPTYTTPVFMGTSSANSSHMVGVPLIRMIPNMPISKADKLAFDAMMSERYPGWPGIDNTKEAEQFMYSGKIPGSAITNFVKYASAKKWQGAGFPDVEEVMFSAMDPRLVGVKQGSTGFGFKEFRPGETPIVKSNDYHPDYPAAIPGKEYAGGFKYQVPQSLMFPDWWESLKPELRQPENATMAQHTLMTQVPTQKATNEWADKILEYWDENPIKWGYADGGEVDDDINDALRIAKANGGPMGDDPAVFMTDANGVSYDASGKVIQPKAETVPQSDATADPSSTITRKAPENYYTDVQPLIDYAVTPIDRPGMPSEPDLVNVMRVATQVAAQGQPQRTTGEANWAENREEAVNKLYGADQDTASPARKSAAWIGNRLIDFSPVGWGEFFHDVPYEAGRTGDYGTAAAQAGLVAALTPEGRTVAQSVAKPVVEAAKQFPKTAATALGVGAATAGSDQAEAGPSRWFSKALEVAGALPMEKMTGEQALAMLRKSVSPEELYWTGTENFLSSTPKVSKGELIDYLKNNRMQPNEVVLGGGNPWRRQDVVPDEEVKAQFRDRLNAAYQDQAKSALEYKTAKEGFDRGTVSYDDFRKSSRNYSMATSIVQDVEKQIVDAQIAKMGGLGTPTRYGPHNYQGKYATSGGTGYTENLFTIPDSWGRYNQFVDSMRAKYGKGGLDNLPLSQGERATLDRLQNSIGDERSRYHEGHWERDDVLAHARTQMLEATFPGANRPYKAFNMDEAQSKWGQDARTSGVRPLDYEYRVNNMSDQLRELRMAQGEEAKAVMDKFYDAYNPLKTKLANEENEIKANWRKSGLSLSELNTQLEQAYEKYLPYVQPLFKERDEAIAAIDAKYRPQITPLEAEYENLKKLKNGVPPAPYIGSTEGWTDLTIKKSLDRALDSDAEYFTWTPGEEHVQRYGLENHVNEIQYYKDNDGKYVLGITDKEGEGVELPKTSYSDDELEGLLGKEMAEKIKANEGNSYRGRQGKTLEGLDLKIGGKGMRDYYEKIFRKRVEEVVKKATGEKPKIEIIEVQTADGPRQQLGIRLTDQMREKARFSDFQKGGRVTDGNTHDNNTVVDRALSLTREF